jgi:hypothetical protein
LTVPATLTPGNYELRLLANNGFTSLATGPIVIAPPGAQISATPATLTAGSTVTAAWSGIATPTATDWIGLYSAGAANTAFIDWMYVSCSKTPGNEINLAWTDNSNNEIGFKVERSQNGGAFTQIATVGANVTTFQNTGLKKNNTYSYRVRAYNAAGDSAYSNVASGSP